MINFEDISQLGTAIQVWIKVHVLVVGNLIQVLAIIAAFFLGLVLARRTKPRLKGLLADQPWAERKPGRVLLTAIDLTGPVIVLLLLGSAFTLAAQNKWPNHLLETALSLLTAWVIIRQVTAALGRTIWTRLIAVSVMIIAGLNILGLLDATMTFLDKLDLTLGQIRISVLHVLKGLLILAILMRLAQAARPSWIGVWRRCRNLPLPSRFSWPNWAGSGCSPWWVWSLFPPWA